MRALTLVLCLAAFAAADNSQLAEKLKKRKLDRFFKKTEQAANLNDAVRKQIMDLREGATLGGEFGAIHQALLAMSSQYKRADALLMDDRFAAAAELLEGLMTSEDEYLRAYSTFRYALAQMNREDFETAIPAFVKVLNQYGRYVGCDVEAAFYLAVSLGQAREKEKAIVAAQRFLDDYPDAPERYRRAMEQMKNELVQEWESPLYDLAGRMSGAARRIEGGKTGDKTQGDQKEIVGIIDELIKRAQQQEGDGQSQGGGGDGAPRGNQQSGSPANKSQAPRGASRMGAQRPAPKKAGDKWGMMRDKERDEVLQALKETMPDRYRDLLEQYHRALAEGKRVTEQGDAEGGDGR